MMLGLGTPPQTDSTTPHGTAVLPTFTDGLKLWTTPGTALSVVGAMAKEPKLALAPDAVGFTVGVLAVPLAAVLLLMNMNEGQH